GGLKANFLREAPDAGELTLIEIVGNPEKELDEPAILGSQIPAERLRQAAVARCRHEVGKAKIGIDDSAVDAVAHVGESGDELRSRMPSVKRPPGRRIAVDAV